ncbi:MAG: primosomal protein N' [Bacteroidales bacterium]|jgi:primosomal protein N' (replication factor Y)|nr:primosomal protein N' [Bacteroidales bacterium]
MDNQCDNLFVEVILPLHLPATFTYRVPRIMAKEVTVGQRVAVQFGGKRIYSAVVAEIHTRIPNLKSVKYIISIIDTEPVVYDKHIAFWRWVASYYCCYIGDVLTAALPAAFRLKSESKVIVNPEFEGDISELSRAEIRILEIVSKNESTTIEEITVALKDECNIMTTVQTLMKKQVLVTDEELFDRYKPLKESVISLSAKYRNNDANLQALFAELESNKKFEKQYNALLTYFSLRRGGNYDISKTEILAKGVSLHTLNTLENKEVIKIEKKAVSRLHSNEASLQVDNLILTKEQQAAFDGISSQPEGSVSLLHGVTSSGKTEVYIKLIEKTLQNNKQILFLLPEIALTAQLIQRLEKYFGSKVGVYHSRFSKEERIEIWNKVKGNKPDGYSIVVGSRSAVFLPFETLGLVIVDEEHDSSFKQFDPAPRYNGKDAALWLAKQHNALAVLGSATPSVESYYYAQSHKYALFTLTERYSKIPLPEILIADTKEAARHGKMHSMFSKMLLDCMATALNKGEQVILFQNRRGYSPVVQCDVCGYIPKCKNCDVSLTLHKQSASMNCHYCDAHTALLKVCPQCGSGALRMMGFGTEKIEEELAIYFPKARIARMDLDSTKGKASYQKIIAAFANRETDILVGTQMISKGLDFENVSLVGIMNADNLISIPDFRSYERAFQMMTQVSGRSGRRQAGKVVIQTINPYHQCILDVSKHNFASMFNSQILERKFFRYPPFFRMICISLSHQSKEVLDAAATEYATSMRSIFSNERIFGPVIPPVSRIRNRYINQIWLKLEAKLSYSAAKQEIMRLNEAFSVKEQHRSIRIAIDIDPQ